MERSHPRAWHQNSGARAAGALPPGGQRRRRAFVGGGVRASHGTALSATILEVLGGGAFLGASFLWGLSYGPPLGRYGCVCDKNR